MASSMWRRVSIQIVRTSERFLSNSPEPPRRFVAMWGNGDYGRLGLGGLESKWRPTACTFFRDDDLPVSIACGGAHTLFLTESGRVYASGLNKFGQLGIKSGTGHVMEPVEVFGFSEKVVQISAGYHHSSAITEDGDLFTWGNNSSGQLGLGRKADSIVSTPTRVDCLVGIKVSKIALGSEHSIAITDEGSVLSWGAGGSGRLGHGHQSSLLGFSMSSSEYTPRLIKNFEGTKVKRVAAGMLHSACIDEQGSVFIFGERAMDKLGFGEAKNASRPLAIQELPFSEEVACGGYHTCVVTNEGRLYTWGSNENGCLGLCSMNIVHTPQDLRSSLLKFPISQVSCGWKHTAAISGGNYFFPWQRGNLDGLLLQDLPDMSYIGGNVYTWGWGGAQGTFFEEGHSSGGQLGHGNDLDCYEPMIINVDRHVKALQISCGFNHTGGIFEYNSQI